ncbi:MAG: hypothetical protein NVS2B7_10230 [Herpetosiphon sp.]
MKRRAIMAGVLIGSLLLGSPCVPGWTAGAASSRLTSGEVESQPGSWRTCVLTSGSQLRLPRPPSQATTRAELRTLRTLASQRDAASLDLIAFWDAGSPGYRWNELAINTAVKHSLPLTRAMRALTLVNVAIYDATVAAWDSKYTYHRSRPVNLDRRVKPVLTTPASPSYPSEHAVAAGAASQVLAYLFPADAQRFMDGADAAGRSRILAGVQYPSDVTAGLALGRTVGDLVIARAKTDGSDVPWSGSVPTDPGHWTGTNPVEPTLGSWKPWVLTTGSQLRPARRPQLPRRKRPLKWQR